MVFDTSAKNNNIKVPLITNGFSLSENFLKKTPGIWGLDSIRVSLYGVDKDSYQFITRVEKSYEIVKKNAITFLNLRNEINKDLKFGFNFIIIPENVNQLNGIISLIKEINDNVENGEGVNFLTLRDEDKLNCLYRLDFFRRPNITSEILNIISVFYKEFEIMTSPFEDLNKFLSLFSNEISQLKSELDTSKSGDEIKEFVHQERLSVLKKIRH